MTGDTILYSVFYTMAGKRHGADGQTGKRELWGIALLTIFSTGCRRKKLPPPERGLFFVRQLVVIAFGGKGTPY